MKYLIMLFIAIVCSIVVYINYLAIKSINNNENFDRKSRNDWVFLVLYFPIFGTLIYLYKKRNNKL